MYKPYSLSGPLYNMLRYSTVVDITLIIVGSQFRVLTRILKIGVKMRYFLKCWILSIVAFQKVGVRIKKLDLKTLIPELRRTLPIGNFRLFAMCLYVLHKFDC